MPISQELLDILACPKCKGSLRLTEANDGLSTFFNITQYAYRPAFHSAAHLNDLPNTYPDTQRPEQSSSYTRLTQSPTERPARLAHRN